MHNAVQCIMQSTNNAGKGALVFKAPRHVDVHFEPLRFCVVAENLCGAPFEARGRPWASQEMVLYHGDVIRHNSTVLVLSCAEVPWWTMPRLPIASAPSANAPAPRPPRAQHNTPGRPAQQQQPQQPACVGAPANGARPVRQPTLAGLERARAEKLARTRSVAGGQADVSGAGRAADAERQQQRCALRLELCRRERERAECEFELIDQNFYVEVGQFAGLDRNAGRADRNAGRAAELHPDEAQLHPAERRRAAREREDAAWHKRAMGLADLHSARESERAAERDWKRANERAEQRREQ